MCGRLELMVIAGTSFGHLLLSDHFLFLLRETLYYGISFKQSVSIFDQRLRGLIVWQLNAHCRKTPKYWGDAAIYNSKFITHKIGFFTEYWRDRNQTLTQLFSGFIQLRRGTNTSHYRVNQVAPIFLNSIDPQTALRSSNRINRKQRWMRKSLVEVFHHNVCFI